MAPMKNQNKRAPAESTDAPTTKQYRGGFSWQQAEQTVLHFRQVKIFHTTPFTNEVTFGAKVIRLKKKINF